MENTGNKLQLYIWTDFCPDYTPGLAFAVAETKEEAEHLIEKEHGFEVYNWGTLEVRPLNVKTARCVYGGG
jgi:hypothetical protein